MSFLLTLPSLKRMAAVKVCGSLWKNESPLRQLADIVEDDEDDDEKDPAELERAMENQLMQHLSLFKLPHSLEKELCPIIKQMGQKLYYLIYGFGSMFGAMSRDFDFTFLSQVRFDNRGDVDTFATTKRHLEEDGALRQMEAWDLLSWISVIGNPEIIKAELNRNGKQLHESAKEEADNYHQFWARYVDEPLPASEIEIATNVEVLEIIMGNGFQQGIDFAFSLLTKPEKLSFMEEKTSSLIHISPIAWARLILELPTPRERDVFYREYGYLILLCIVWSWPYHDLFNAALVELMPFLSVKQFAKVALTLASLVPKSDSPYDPTAGDMFLLFWESASEDIRSQFIRYKKNLSKLKAFLSKEARCYAVVAGKKRKLNQ